VGDVDDDLKDEVAVDFGMAGIWLYDQGSWTQLAPENPESLFGTHLRYSAIDILADLGPMGLWMWHGTWTQLSAIDVESMADGFDFIGLWSEHGQTVLFADFGGMGLWLLYFGGVSINPPPNWVQLSGENADSVVTARFGPSPSVVGFSYVFGDFGSLGLWRCFPWMGSSQWAGLSDANAEYVAKGRQWVAADFGSLGLWIYNVSSGWAQLTGVNADFVIPADTNVDFIDEIVVDFGALGLWLWDSVQWTQLTDANAEYMISADVTGDRGDEIAVDLGSNGLWVWNDGTWGQISFMDPEYILSADTNGDGAKEILADFGASGLWLWNGAWAQISEDNPD
jgi:hypothetical protein